MAVAWHLVILYYFLKSISVSEGFLVNLILIKPG